MSMITQAPHAAETGSHHHDPIAHLVAFVIAVGTWLSQPAPPHQPG